MENRRPLRVQRKEDILRLQDTLSKEDSEEISSEEETQEDTQSLAEEPRKKKEKKDAKEGSYVLVSTLVLMLVYLGYMYTVYRKCSQGIEKVESANKGLRLKIEELESLFHSKYKEVDVADYLEGARIIYDLTTPPYEKKRWNMKTLKGHSGEVAIDKVCAKGYCYSFKGSEGKLAVAFKNEKIIRKIGISHPIFDSRASAIKNFTVDCIVNNQEQRIGEFEYEIPGDSFQQFTIPPTKCTGIILRVKSNHGHKEYTCIYKVYAFE
ncbi:hypothetical protein NECID01_1889 [Nematocida sp. AWRm77]|nr:hypothetical protein NECID01_1889 [Nematocida sp. AWRm77]